MKHEKFHYRSLNEVHAEADRLGVELPLSQNTKLLFQPFQFGKYEVHNRIAFQPMEGTDGLEDGSPGALTVRRYERFAKAGPGVIWFEAVATVPEGRASKHQLALNEKNLDSFKALLDRIREISLRENGYAPLVIMQATNSGRYSKPEGVPAPKIAYHNPLFEETPLSDACVLDDEALERYEAAFGPMARLCQAAGFDGMDVKACHRYLACELLSAYIREGKYGGSYENRTRFLKNCYRAAAANVTQPGFFLTSRLNIYDGFAYPYGFGVRPGSLDPALEEPIRLIHELKEEFNIPLINVTMGNPYKNPHVNRPYDRGNYIPNEHPFEGLGRLMKGIGDIQTAIPDLPVIGSGFSYLRQFSTNLAAGMIEKQRCAMAGFGRLAFAHPDFIREVRENGAMDAKKTCLTCGGCAALLRAGIPAGCVVRDRENYRL